MSDGPGEERREFPRLPVQLTVDYVDADDLVADYTTNISIGGTFIITEQKVELGATVELALSFPGLLQPLSMSGIVRWSQQKTGDLRGVGIEFVEIGPETQMRLEEFLERIQSGDPALVTRPLRVLLVDDNEHVAGLIRQGLALISERSEEALMFVFETAKDGRHGLDLFSELQPDLVIVDLQLPVLDGLSLISQLRIDGTETPIIAISALGDEGRKPALRAGANMYLPKPVRFRDLGNAVTSIMDAARRADQ